jgi:hypothetical protein
MKDANNGPQNISTCPPMRQDRSLRSIQQEISNSGNMHTQNTLCVDVPSPLFTRPSIPPDSICQQGSVYLHTESVQ